MRQAHASKGFALITVLLSFIGLFALLSALLIMTATNQSQTLKTNDFAKAYTVAESGLNIRISELNEIFYDLANTNPNSDTLFVTLESEFALLPSEIAFPQTSMDDRAVLSMTPIDGSDDYPTYVFYRISSIGIVNGIQRTLSKEIGFSYTKGGPGLVIGKAILTLRGMEIGLQNSTVIGPIASNLLDGSTIQIASDQDQIPMVYVPTDKTSSIITLARIGSRVSEVTEPFFFPTINYPSIPLTTPTTINAYTFVNNQATISVTGYSYLENLTVASGQTLIVNLGSRGTASTKKMLKVKNINVGGNIRVIGTGRLLLVYDYGVGTLTMGSKFNVCGNVVGSCKTTNPDYTKFLFYLRTPNIIQGDIGNYPTLGFSNLQLFYGSILAQYVNIDVKSDNFKGHIVTAGNTVNFSANAIIHEALFYVPFGTLTIDSNAVLSGSLVGNYVKVANPQTIVQYIEVNKETFPFNIDFPVTEQAAFVPGSADVIEGGTLEN